MHSHWIVEFHIVVLVDEDCVGGIVTETSSDVLIGVLHIRVDVKRKSDNTDVVVVHEERVLIAVVLD